MLSAQTSHYNHHLDDAHVVSASATPVGAAAAEQRSQQLSGAAASMSQVSTQASGESARLPLHHTQAPALAHTLDDEGAQHDQDMPLAGSGGEDGKGDDHDDHIGSLPSTFASGTAPARAASPQADAHQMDQSGTTERRTLPPPTEPSAQNSAVAASTAATRGVSEEPQGTQDAVFTAPAPKQQAQQQAHRTTTPSPTGAADKDTTDTAAGGGNPTTASKPRAGTTPALTQGSAVETPLSAGSGFASVDATPLTDAQPPKKFVIGTPRHQKPAAKSGGGV